MKRLLPIFILVCGLAIALSVQGAEFNLGFLGAKSPKDADIVGYIDRVYRGSLYVASILAVGMIVVGGLYFSLSGVIDRKSEGKEMIRDAILGLVLLFGATIIFQTVSPNIAKLSPPKLATLTTAYPACSGDEEKEVEFKLNNPHTWASLEKPPDKDNPDKDWCFPGCATPQTISCNVVIQEEPTCLTSAPQPFFARLLGSSDTTCEKPSCLICAPIPVAVSCPADTLKDCQTEIIKYTDEAEIQVFNRLFTFEDAQEYCENTSLIFRDDGDLQRIMTDRGLTQSDVAIVSCFARKQPNSRSYKVTYIPIFPPADGVDLDFGLPQYSFYTKGTSPDTATCRAWAIFEQVTITDPDTHYESKMWKKKDDLRDSTWIQC